MVAFGLTSVLLYPEKNANEGETGKDSLNSKFIKREVPDASARG
jgi:hypothetical protein